MSIEKVFHDKTYNEYELLYTLKKIKRESVESFDALLVKPEGCRIEGWFEND
jgi:predicted Zn-ribbon and HTH transcriptional regulator